MAEVERGAVERPVRAGFFIGAKQQAHAFLACVGAGLIVVDLRQLETEVFDLGQGVGDQVMMFDRGQRQFDTGQGCYFPTPQASRIDNKFGVQLAIFGDHIPAAVGALRGRNHRSMPVDLGAELARGRGEGLGCRGRVNVTTFFLP